VVLQWLSRRWIFGLVLPVAVLIAVVGGRRLTNHGEQQPGTVDWPSVLLATAGFGGLVCGLSRLGAATSVVSPYALITVGVGAVLAVGVLLLAFRLPRRA
jgi:MFS transporter, DHA2 family, lincomycin resistance protein